MGFVGSIELLGAGDGDTVGSGVSVVSIVGSGVVGLKTGVDCSSTGMGSLFAGFINAKTETNDTTIQTTPNKNISALLFICSP
jgi:hypothetical protein